MIGATSCRRSGVPAPGNAQPSSPSGARSRPSALFDAAAAAALDAAVTLREHRRQRARLARGQPQPQQVAPARRLGPVLEGRAVVQQRVVVNELHVAGLQRHREMQRRVVAQRVEQVQRFDLQLARGRRIGEALRRIDVLALVDRRQPAVEPAEHRDLEIRLRTRRHFAASVGGQRLEQLGCQVGAPRAQLVVQRGRRDQRRQPAAPRRLQAQQADDVGRIGVEGLPFVGLVDAHVRIAGRQARGRARAPAHGPARSAIAPRPGGTPSRRRRWRSGGAPSRPPAGHATARSRGPPANRGAGAAAAAPAAAARIALASAWPGRCARASRLRRHRPVPPVHRHRGFRSIRRCAPPCRAPARRWRCRCARADRKAACSSQQVSVLSQQRRALALYGWIRWGRTAVPCLENRQLPDEKVHHRDSGCVQHSDIDSC